MRSSHRTPSCPTSNEVSELRGPSFRSRPATSHNSGRRIIGQPSQHSQREATMGTGGIGPCVAKRPETRVPIGDRGKGVQEIPRRACQPVEPGHHQDIASADLVEGLAELGAVGLYAARSLTEHFFTSSLGELAHLRVHALTVGGYPWIAVDHGIFMHLVNAPEKPPDFNASILVHASRAWRWSWLTERQPSKLMYRPAAVSPLWPQHLLRPI